MSLKICLDEKASEALRTMLHQLKEEHPECSISISGLTSWVLINFFQSGFEKTKDKIASHHFNPKAFLKNRMKGLDSPEKLEAALLEIRDKIKTTKGKPERKVDGD